MNNKEKYALVLKRISIEKAMHEWIIDGLQKRLNAEEENFKKTMRGLEAKKTQIEEISTGLDLVINTDIQAKEKKEHPKQPPKEKQTPTQKLISDLSDILKSVNE